jgi:membrane-bound metal-dependent hydrolase YbcI (DUF457 family)
MASPIAHSFAGFWTFLVFAKQLQIRLTAQWRQYWCQYLLQLSLLVLLANLPDFDFPLSLALLGNDSLHHGFTHSLAAAVLVALAVSCVWHIAPGFWRSAMIYFTAYGSHLVIDLCTGRTLGWTNTGSGIPLLWPWPKNFSSPLILIPGVRHTQALRGIFSLDNAWSGIYELLACGAITAVAFILWKRKLKSQTLGKRKLKSRPNRLTSEVSKHLLSELQHQR